MESYEQINSEQLNPPTPTKMNGDNKVVDKYTTYVLKRLQKILTKSIHRQFFSTLRSHVYNIVKQSNKPIWKYHKLFIKQKPTQQEQMFKQFVVHSATKIQSFFKMFIKRRQFKTSKRIFNNLTKWIKGKKVRMIMNCKKISQMRKRFCEINKKFDEAIVNCKPVGALMKQNNYLLEMFNQQFEFLYTTGGWIYEEKSDNERILKPHVHKQNTTIIDERPIKQIKNQSNINDERPIKKMEKSNIHDSMPNESLVKSEYYSKEPKKQDIPHQPKKENSGFQDERPIKSTGAYSFDEKPITINKKPQKIEQKELDPNQNNSKQQNAPQPIKHKRLVRKQVYDPKKAIASQNKQNKQLLKAQPHQESKEAKQSKSDKQIQQPGVPKQAIKKSQVITSIDHSLEKTPVHSKKFIKEGIKNARQKTSKKVEKIQNKSIENISGIKQTKSRIDCWNKPLIDQKKKKQVEQAYYEQADDIDSYDIDSFKNIPRQRLKQRIAQQINKINQNIKHLRIKKEKKYKNEDPEISVLEKVYDDQYSKRYLQLKPKLITLENQRNQSKIRSIPYLLNESDYAIMASNSVSTQQYYELEKDIIINYEQLKKM